MDTIVGMLCFRGKLSDCGRKKIERENVIFGTPRFRMFLVVTVGGLDVKSLVEDNGEG